MTQNAVDEKKAKAEANKLRSADMDKREKELNSSRTGKGKRIELAMTRGKNPQEIQYEAWDESQPDTLPKDLNEFMTLSKVEDEKEIVRRLILGDNEIAYTEASDPVAEYVEASWPEDVQKQFRFVIRNYSTGAKVSIEDAVAAIKPAFTAAQSAAQTVGV